MHNSLFSFDVVYKTHAFNVSNVVESALQNPHWKSEFCQPHHRKSVSYVSQKRETFSCIFISHFLDNSVYITVCEMYYLAHCKKSCVLYITSNTVHNNVHFISSRTLYIHSCVHYILVFTLYITEHIVYCLVHNAYLYV